MVIFGDGSNAGKGESLVASLESYRMLLQETAGPELDEAIDLLLYTGPLAIGDYQESWLYFNFSPGPHDQCPESPGEPAGEYPLSGRRDPERATVIRPSRRVR